MKKEVAFLFYVIILPFYILHATMYLITLLLFLALQLYALRVFLLKFSVLNTEYFKLIFTCIYNIDVYVCIVVSVA